MSFIFLERGQLELAKESKFQSELIKELEKEFPGCIVTKLNPAFKTGIPDLLILYNNKWATLECKDNAKASHQPLQDYYVEKMDEMSFAKFIFPENKKEVLDELRKTFGA